MKKYEIKGKTVQQIINDSKVQYGLFPTVYDKTWNSWNYHKKVNKEKIEDVVEYMMKFAKEIRVVRTTTRVRGFYNTYVLGR